MKMLTSKEYHGIKKVLRLSLTLAKFKFILRNERSYIGIFWYLLEPLAAFGILLLLGGALNQNQIPQYPLYLLIGLALFNFFMAVTSFSVNSMNLNADFLKSMNIASEPFVISGLIQYMFSHSFEIILLVLLAFYLKVPLFGFLIYPLIFAFFSLFTLGCAFILATIGVHISDMANIWVIFGRLLWFATPVFYSVNHHALLRTFNQLNPIYYFISAARDIIIDNRLPDFGTVIFIILSSIVLFFTGIFIFIKNKGKFAERL